MRLDLRSIWVWLSFAMLALLGPMMPLPTLLPTLRKDVTSPVT